MLNMKLLKRVILSIWVWFLLITGVFWLSAPINKVHAQALVMEYRAEAPSEVNVGEKFKVVYKMYSSTPLEVQMARLVIKFDADTLKIVDVTANKDLFCTYPQDVGSYVVNNKKGIFVLTGIADGTQTCPYPKVDSNGVSFVEITFEALQEGSAVFDYLYDGTNGSDDVSAIIANGSPPGFVLKQPEPFTIQVNAEVTPSPTLSPTPTSAPTTAPQPVPDTGVLDSWPLALGIGFTMLVIGFRMLYNKKITNKVDIVIHEPS